MKRSSTIPLLLLGTLLAGCEPTERESGVYSDDQVRQSSYASKEACQSDWGKDDKDCKPHSSGVGYVGPRYIWNRSLNQPVAIDPGGTFRPLPNSYITSSRMTTATNDVSVGSVSHAAVSEGIGISGRGGFGATAHAGGGESGGG